MQGYCKSVQAAVQAFGAGPVSRVSKEELERHERIAMLKAYNHEVQAWIDQTLLERKEMERQEQLKAQQGAAVPRAKPPKKKKAAAARPAPVEWPPVAEAGAVPGMACSRQAAAEVSAAAAAAWAATAAGWMRRQRRPRSVRPASLRGSTLLARRSGSGRLRPGTQRTRHWRLPGRPALTHLLCWKRMRRCRRRVLSRHSGRAGAPADRRVVGFRPAGGAPFCLIGSL